MNGEDVPFLPPTPGFIDTRDAPTRVYCPKPFQKGNPSHLGKKRRGGEIYYKKFREVFDLQKFGEVVQKLYELALEGDVKAAKLLLDKSLPDRRLEDFMKALEGSGAAAAQLIVVTREELDQRKEALRAKVVS